MNKGGIRLAGLIAASVIATPALANQNQATAQGTFLTVDPTKPIPTHDARGEGIQSVSGTLKGDGAAPQVDGNYSLSVGNGHMKFSSTLTSKSKVVGEALAGLDFTGRLSDTISATGGKKGQVVFMHRTIQVTGSSTSKQTTPARGTTVMAAFDARLDSREATIFNDFAPSPGHTRMGSAFMTDFHEYDESPDGVGRKLDRTLGPSSTIDYVVPIVIGEDNTFAFDLVASFELHVLGAPNADWTVSKNFDINLAFGDAFFTSATADGVDSNKRLTPVQMSALKFNSTSGFDYLADFGTGTPGNGGGAGAVPEPASWALMLGGFGLIGSVMRASKRKTAVAFN